ncbi:MAG TPA: hypothetical protein VE075_04185 [Thermoanaerobaculia bacterium]|nr:hypothetical protein [Thermoanaerobaculia bacterium]
MSNRATRGRQAGAAAVPGWEWAAAVTLTAAVAALALVRMLHAGGLWRDEAGAARLATLPTLREVVGLFQHEAFLPLFPVTVRAYSHLVGGGDRELRAFGLAVGLCIAACLWLNARTTARTVPLLSLALLGLDAPFLVFGDSVRGYGMGSALILLTYGLLARALAGKAGDRQWPLALLIAIAAVASVQVLMSNAALLAALCAAAAAVAVARRRFGLAAWIVGCGAAAALSLLPYAAQLAAARRQWSVIVTYPIGVHQIALAFADTVGPRPVLFVWLLLIVAGLTGVGRELARRRPAGRRQAAEAADDEKAREAAKAAKAAKAAPATRAAEAAAAVQEPSWSGAAAFAGLTIAGAVLANYLFLQNLGYPLRPWYFLPLMALLASALDTIFGVLSRSRGRLATVRFTTMRLAAVALIAVAQAVPLWRHLASRQTNADLVAQAVTSAVGPQDLVVVLPWYYGVSFNRYYTGAAHWLTLPEIPDHRIHRYDYLKARLASPHPLDDLLAAVGATLRSGHRVWLAGSVKWPAPGEPVVMLPPAPTTAAGWHDYPYLVDWSLLLGRFLESHATAVTKVAVPAGEPVSNLEDMSLAVAQGWREVPGQVASSASPPARPSLAGASRFSSSAPRPASARSRS